MAFRAGGQCGERHRKFYEGLADELAQAARAAVLTPTFEIDPSPAAQHLWQWFLDLHTGRQLGMDGPLPLGWAEMAHWASMTAQRVHPAEWRILRAMDAAWLAACAEATQWDQQSAAAPHTYSERPMTPELFDAIF